jgi:hypothetical protein
MPAIRLIFLKKIWVHYAICIFLLFAALLHAFLVPLEAKNRLGKVVARPVCHFRAHRWPTWNAHHSHALSVGAAPLPRPGKVNKC